MKTSLKYIECLLNSISKHIKFVFCDLLDINLFGNRKSYRGVSVLLFSLKTVSSHVIFAEISLAGNCFSDNILFRSKETEEFPLFVIISFFR